MINFDDKRDFYRMMLQTLSIRGKVVRIDEEFEGCFLVGIAIEELD